VSAARRWIAALGLAPHPEGGFYRETYRAAGRIGKAGLPARYGGPRAYATLIYFLLRRGDVSRLHRLRSDEIWHFYAGGRLTLHLIDPRGRYRRIRLGPNPGRGERFQAVVPAGTWFGATVDAPAAYALVGCTVAPGFEFADFELGGRAGLLRRFPAHRRIIERLTAQGG